MKNDSLKILLDNEHKKLVEETEQMILDTTEYLAILQKDTRRYKQILAKQLERMGELLKDLDIKKD
jgi:hypothetical protein